MLMKYHTGDSAELMIIIRGLER